MSYVFWGTPRFAEIVLNDLLAADMPPMALVCNPDRPVGRKKIVTPRATKVLVTKQAPNVKILQPETFNEQFIKELRALHTDVFVVAAYAKIIPKGIIEIPRFGTLGIHPSLLPKHRGSSPIQSAILNGDTETGVTIYQVDEKMDHGSVLAREETRLNPLATDYATLEETLAKQGAALFLKVLSGLGKGRLVGRPQRDDEATYTKKFTSRDGFVSDEDLLAAERGDTKKAEVILRKVNALGKEPGVWTTMNGVRTKLLRVGLEEDHLVLREIQREGETPRKA